MNNTTSYNFGLLLLRVGFGAMMLTHGIPKLLKMLSGDFSFGDPIGIGETATLILAVLCEVLFPLLVIIGFKTRLSAIPVIITMTVAAFIVHATDPFGTKEMAILYLIGFIAIALLGAGKYSIDKKQVV
ncbi:MAG: DoxX family protein [Aequorivita sp.]|nr:DoxX family protein [Aequorivita sp.]